MQYVADLHLHSKYSRAVSQSMTLPVMAEYAKQKGLDILSASDFTHPLWFKEMSAQLEEVGDGIYQLKGTEEPDGPKETKDKEQIYFLLSTEIASIYKQGDKLRRIHNLVFAPNLETVEKISDSLVARGANLNADGRPIIGLSSKQLLELILEQSEDCFLIPCHIWTPHFGIYGSASGFDSLEEAFGDLAQYIYGIETGLSSDPDMNWSIAELKSRSILSFSDAHSPAKMGRECTVFELEGTVPTYKQIKEAIMFPLKRAKRDQGVRGDKGEETTPGPSGSLVSSGTSRILYTIEFYPEEGKYHFSGHRNCKVSYGPEEIREKGTICPVCRRQMTEGVLLRVQQLADHTLINRVESKRNASGLQWCTDKSKQQPPYVKLVPLLEIVAEGMHSTTASQKVKDMFSALCRSLGSEIEVLLKAPIDEIREIAGDRVAEGVDKVRRGDIIIEPGYDGEYGKVQIWREGEDVAKDTGDKNQTQLELEL